ncbi:excisionase [Mucilaginibacter sp. MD40]|nr:excisionase [Mucilaginibacter sp. MD40]
MQQVVNDDPLFDRKTAAKYLGLTNPNTLAVWDCTKRYDLSPIKVGGAIRYRKSALDRFLFEGLKKKVSR